MIEVGVTRVSKTAVPTRSTPTWATRSRRRWVGRADARGLAFRNCGTAAPPGRPGGAAFSLAVLLPPDPRVLTLTAARPLGLLAGSPPLARRRERRRLPNALPNSRATVEDPGRSWGPASEATRSAGERGLPGGDIDVTSSEKTALRRRLEDAEQRAREAQARADAAESTVKELQRRSAPPWEIVEPAQAAARARKEADRADREAAEAVKAIGRAMRDAGLPEDATVADWLEQPD